MPLTRTFTASVAGQSSGRRTVAPAKNRCSLATLDLPYVTFYYNQMAVTISSVKARHIFDSRGTTVEADIGLSDGSFMRGAVPNSASTDVWHLNSVRDEFGYFDYRVQTHHQLEQHE